MVGRVKYNVMSDQELQYLKSRMEQLLIERGIHLDHEELLSELDKLGCAVDMEKKDVRFTKELIDRAVAAVPEKFTLYSPSGKYDLEFPNPNGSFYTPHQHRRAQLPHHQRRHPLHHPGRGGRVVQDHQCDGESGLRHAALHFRRVRARRRRGCLHPGEGPEALRQAHLDSAL